MTNQDQYENVQEIELDNGTTLFIEGNADGTCPGCCEGIIEAIEDITGEFAPVAIANQVMIEDEWYLTLKVLIGVTEETAADLVLGYPVKDGIHLSLDNGDITLTAVDGVIYESGSAETGREILDDLNEVTE